MRVKITPAFNVNEIMLGTIRKDWFIFQSDALQLGMNLANYMQTFISTRHKRRGASGKLASSITFEPNPNSTGQIGWGVGDISVLNAKAPYWYVVNYGKTVGGQPFIPAKGKFVPGSFEGNAPSPALKGGVQKFNKGDGSGMGMFPKSAIRPMNYIQASRAKFNRDFSRLLARIRKGL